MDVLDGNSLSVIVLDCFVASLYDGSPLPLDVTVAPVAAVGYGIMYLTALNAHLAVGDAFVPFGLMAILFFALLLTSYITFHKLQAAKNN